MSNNIHIRRHGQGMVAAAILTGGRDDCIHYYLGTATDADGWQDLVCRDCGRMLRVNTWVPRSQYEQYGIEDVKKIPRSRGARGGGG